MQNVFNKNGEEVRFRRKENELLLVIDNPCFKTIS